MAPRILLTLLLAAAHLMPASVSAADAANVDIKLFLFKPKELAVKRGDTVTWTNGDAIEHSVTSGRPGKPTEAFDSGFFTKGGNFSYTFEVPGSFAYFCKRHPNMRATVKVEP